ncbi:MAG TPA: hypothetical protein VMK84_25150 [Streptosporangiaceae bacterium]|nr:hypothetical protein [Streptosporangiaceae bacterium]
MTSEMERLDKHRGQLRTGSGPVSYVDTGGPGRPVLFVHGHPERLHTLTLTNCEAGRRAHRGAPPSLGSPLGRPSLTRVT